LSKIKVIKEAQAELFSRIACFAMLIGFIGDQVLGDLGVNGVWNWWRKPKSGKRRKIETGWSCRAILI
jgi:hypothetical protein